LRVADTRTAPPQLEALARDCADAEFRGGGLAEDLLQEVDLVAVSPGLSPAQPPAAALLKEARRRKIEVLGELELFARELARLRAEHDYAPRVIGVTGTNGKTTTTRLAGLFVERCGHSVAVAGNIGPAALEELGARLDADSLPQVWVLELSSFQLVTTTSLACDAAAVLNVSQDHLDWHGSMDAYVKAKERIFAPRTVRVLNRDDPIVAAMTGRKSTVVTFGAGPPTRPDDFGLIHDGGMTWLAWAEGASLPGRRRRATGAENGPAEVHVHRLMPVDALRVRGRHNALNALAGLALVKALGLPLAPMLHALREYAGEPHRMQFVARIGGVEYFDDSKGTNVGATVAALDGLGAEGRKLVVILGGDGKGQDFAALAAPLARHARAVVLIGRDADTIRAALAALGPRIQLIAADSLPHAVQRAAEKAQSGDTVLLSPACASFDMFRDYRHRADVFTEAVREQAALAGQPC
jgi:UDP-N-acetylmuramoylalanine--D-glutamate ligase